MKNMSQNTPPEAQENSTNKMTRRQFLMTSAAFAGTFSLGNFELSAQDKDEGANRGFAQAPTISLPKGGGAIRGIGEKFTANPVTGTGTFSVPIFTAPGRSGFGPQLSLSYDSGAGNGPFGFGWNLSLPSITRKTDKGLPKYQDADESDVFILSGAEDLVPLPIGVGEEWHREGWMDDERYNIQRYQPRIEGLFARIERWTNIQNGETHWRSISKDNITTLYGRTAESRISDPADPRSVFSWLICESYDDKGNVVLYEYVPEDSAGIDLSQAHEMNRTDKSRSTNRYLKGIRYGNQPSHLVQLDRSQMTWRFEVVFDYDEGHYEELPQNAPELPKFVRATKGKTRDWTVRQDAFSSYRSGFEVRTYRLCHRVLMFHHFPTELVIDDYLVHSTEFTYAQSPIASFITQTTQAGYVRQNNGTYLKKSLPPLEFEYSAPPSQDEMEKIKIREPDAESMENLPYGVDDTRYQWVDLDGEGLTGILTEQANAWFYKPNLGNGNFGPLEVVAAKPSLAALSNGRQQLLDLAGDGQLDLVELSGPSPGFYERTHDQRWKRFTPFASLPNVAWDDPNLKLVDLTGDGHADVMISEDQAFTWYPSLAETGFGPAEKVRQALDEEKGPKLIFSDVTQSIYLADMSGDGLTDLVRIRDGEVCYWPNLGYGRFGTKVTMDASPWFDTPDQFDQRRIRFADIDGSGVTDIIYLGGDGVHLYFNQSGNSWSEARTLHQFPRIDNLSSVTAIDLQGNGTVCLVWSSPLPGEARHPMRYIDLMDGKKPHLLVGMKNNLGAETRVHYTASTEFYLEDKLLGKPWITRLPFPVHVVKRVETYDRISRNRFVTRYAYHHGYFDGVEREFRGFGMVEQSDTEEFAALSAGDAFPTGDNVDETSHVPLVLTRTWFHTGAYTEDQQVSRLFEHEYYRETGMDYAQFQAQLLPDTVLPPGLSAQEIQEAYRSLKGSILRQEIYASDHTAKSEHPYIVSERNYTIKCIQPGDGNRHAVFLVHPRETIDFHYERNPADPRISHALTLEVDAFGNVLKSAAIGYGRRWPTPVLSASDQARQTQILITYAENNFTNSIDTANAYRTPLLCETKSYELAGLTLTASVTRFSLDELLSAGPAAAPIAYEAAHTPGLLQKRLIEHIQTLYRKDDLSGPLPSCQLETLALPYESYKLAFTPELITQVYGSRVTDNMLADDGKYTHFEEDGNWWIPSGQVFYSPDENDNSEEELEYARAHFFLPHRFCDPFGQTTYIDYDYDLLIKQAKDPIGNIVKAENDYRVLQPKMVTDPNENRVEVAFDALGLVVGTAVLDVGDSLDGFEPDLTQAQIDEFYKAADPHIPAVPLLKDATTRIIYDLEMFQRTQSPDDPSQGLPIYNATLARETHKSDPLPDGGLKIQISFSYSDGFEREIQKKIQAEPGPLVKGGPDVEHRWVGSGWTIFNNKGKPVRQYEPFFDDTHHFKFGKKVGVSPILFYDPVERVIATLHPDHTYEKVLFDPWRQETWDVTDTVLQTDPKDDPDVGDFFRRLPDGDYMPTWYENYSNGQPDKQDAAEKTALLAFTPSITYFDTLGRTFLTIAHNKFQREKSDGTIETIEEKHPTHVELDIEGNQRAVIDPLDRIVMRYEYDMLGNRIRQDSMEAGTRWVLNDVAGKPIYNWDSRDHQFHYGYDKLRRPTHLYVKSGTDVEQLIERTVYGESNPDSIGLNLRGKVFKQFDSAGVITNEEYDIKGNLLRSTRQIAEEYKQRVNWSDIEPLLNVYALNISDIEGILETFLDPSYEKFTSSTTYDALNRAVTLTTPDNSVIRPTYNEANLLERIDVNLQAADEATAFIKDIDYDAKGQRVLIEYGNDVRTTYEYDKKTYRLTHLQTLRGTERLQDLSYTYDPAGNITFIRDDAQQTIYFNGMIAEPNGEFTYDAVYRLISASGREHVGQTSQSETTWDDRGRTNPQDKKMRPYNEYYEYDEAGNIKSLRHQAKDGNWPRRYSYNEPSLLEPTRKNNRLTSTTVGNMITGYTENYTYDEHGNMTSMPHLPQMAWDVEDQLQMVDKDGGGKAYYVYDSSGQRVRKVWEKSPGLIEERIYLGGFEVFRRRDGNGNITLERETLHIMGGEQRIALVETRTQGNDNSPYQLIRYQFANHLGSAFLELDEGARIISYEEYYPYGSTSYQAVRKDIEVPLKRYRYTGKERDEESGLYYHGARYYAPWIARWVSCDPAGMLGSINLYSYANNNPIVFVDKNGTQPQTRTNQVCPGLEGESKPAPDTIFVCPESDKIGWEAVKNEDLLDFARKEGLPVFIYDPNIKHASWEEAYEKARRQQAIYEETTSPAGEIDIVKPVSTVTRSVGTIGRIPQIFGAVSNFLCRGRKFLNWSPISDRLAFLFARASEGTWGGMESSLFGRLLQKFGRQLDPKNIGAGGGWSAWAIAVAGLNIILEEIGAPKEALYVPQTAAELTPAGVIVSGYSNIFGWWKYGTETAHKQNIEGKRTGVVQGYAIIGGALFLSTTSLSNKLTSKKAEEGQFGMYVESGNFWGDFWCEFFECYKADWEMDLEDSTAYYGTGPGSKYPR